MQQRDNASTIKNDPYSCRWRNRDTKHQEIVLMTASFPGMPCQSRIVRRGKRGSETLSL